MERNVIVLGGGVAGMVAARALSLHYDRVTLLERDTAWCIDHTPRAGIPQARHPHILLKRGENIIADLFPGFRPALKAREAHTINWADVEWFHVGGWRHHGDQPCELRSLSCSRGMLDTVLSEQLAEVGGVEIHRGARVTALKLEGGSVVGVTYEERETGRQVDLDADLVVDATGRQTPIPKLLQELGRPLPPRMVVNAHFGYATCFVRKTFDRLIAVHATPPASPRMGFAIPLEGDLAAVTLGGFNRDYPPTTAEGFRDFADSMNAPQLSAIVRGAESLSTITPYRNTANRWWRYDKTGGLPRGLIAIGDSVCTFNPVYGQGMSTAAMGAELLLKTLTRGETPAHQFQKRYARSLRLPWLLATMEDSRHPLTENALTGVGAKALQTLIDRILRLGVDDYYAYRSFLDMLHMLQGLNGLATPRMIAKLIIGPPGKRAPAFVSATAALQERELL